MTDELELTTDALELEDLEQRAEGDPHRVTIRLVRWGERAQTAQGPETFARGAFADVDPAQVHLESHRHGGDVWGVGEQLEEREDGAYLTARVSSGPSGQDMLALIRDRILARASVLFRPLQSRTLPDGTVERVRVDLHRVAVLSRGAYASAAVVEARNMDEQVMDAAVAAQEAPPAPAAPTVDLDPILGRMDALEASQAQLEARGVFQGGDQPDQGLVDMYGRSLFDNLELMRRDDELRELFGRALFDQVTTPNTGVVRPAWMDTIQGLVNLGRPTISAFGRVQLPESGMSVSFPKYSDATHAARPHVGVQATEKTEIVSKEITIDDASTPVYTVAGGADLSWQLLQRSSPSYMAAWSAWMMREMVQQSNEHYIGSLVAETTSTDTYDATTDDSGAVLLAKLFEWSTLVETYTGQPASIVMVPTDLWLLLPGMERIVPAYPGNMSNAAGNQLASTLRVSVNGLDLVHDRDLPAGTMFVSNPSTSEYQEDGPKTAEAPEVALLGTNAAVYSFAADVIYNPLGIVNVAVTTGP